MDAKTVLLLSLVYICRLWNAWLAEIDLLEVSNSPSIFGNSVVPHGHVRADNKLIAITLSYFFHAALAVDRSPSVTFVYQNGLG